ncbi:MAG: thermonuclease family protein [Thiobacillus sp.]
MLTLRAVLALCLLFALAVTARAAPLAGVVIVVIDGDTVLFKPDHYKPTSRAFMKVRLADIDAPEQNQPHGEAATETLKALALNQRAQLDIVATDTYGRKVGRLTVGSQSVNREMVRRGFAWASTRYRRDVGLLEAQREAHAAKRGLWQDATPTPPWVWRRAQPASSQ